MAGQDGHKGGHEGEEGSGSCFLSFVPIVAFVPLRPCVRLLVIKPVEGILRALVGFFLVGVLSGSRPLTRVVRRRLLRCRSRRLFGRNIAFVRFRCRLLAVDILAFVASLAFAANLVLVDVRPLTVALLVHVVFIDLDADLVIAIEFGVFLGCEILIGCR